MPTPTLTILRPLNLEGRVAVAVHGSLGLKVGSEVKLVDRKGQDLIFGDVVDIWTGPVVAVPAFLLEYAHDHLQRTFTGLVSHLQCFPDQGPVGEKTTVSVALLDLKQSTLLRPTHRDIAKHS